MTAALQADTVRVNGHDSRVWRKGAGEPLGFLPGIGGLPKWTAFLDRMAEQRTVIAPSLPGFPGAAGHDELDTIFDWLLATRDVLLAAGLEGADLMAVSVSGALAADAAGVWPGLVRRLVLLAPFGLFDAVDPSADIWAQRPGHLSDLMCADREIYKAFIEQPDDADPMEWKVEQMRALAAHARYLFPNGNTGLAKRLGRIECPVLLLRGSEDRVMPASYLDRFARGVPGGATIDEIAGAGHLAELDQPDTVAERVLAFLDA
ncbi:MAG: alpha/beta fold hydrolase [Gammaproteobacteria bacterium]|nr:alpha/beta fold hydrolase [Gammaproteobacteria bacterium]